MPNIGDIIRAEDLQDLLEQINNSSSNIIGELKYFGFNEVPEHCLMCDGSEISRETYSELFAKYGTIYGEGDGSTTFNIPDYRGAFLRCIGGNADSIGVLQGDAIRNIRGAVNLTHSSVYGSPVQTAFQNSVIYGTNQGSYAYITTGSGIGSRTITLDTSRAVPTAEENRPINYAINICVVYE